MSTVPPHAKNPGDRDEVSPSPALFLPHANSAAGASRAGRSLPPDLQQQVTRRLRWTALIYSAAFFFADLFPSIVTGDIRHRFEMSPAHWAPTVASIALGLAVAVLVSAPRLGWSAKVNLGLAFEVLSNYGIAVAQYHMVREMAVQPLVLFALSPSWVAIWMIFFSTVVPAPPGKALVALIASASAPPVVIGLMLHRAGLSHLMSPPEFFFSHVFPYMICVGLAYAGARIVYRLGADVSRARELGSYRLVERLGEGGMGEVWRASHQLLARPAAIKFIRPAAISGSSDAESKTILKRFELEAQATASLSSAHTVDLYDYGVTDEGTFYYVMELLDGMDSDRFVRRFGPMPPGRVVHLMTQICESLEEAHEKGLIHRDVKPANIYICRSGVRCDFVKVLDFGLVAHREAPAKPELRLTQPERAIGTPEFMPPEVALGQAVDGRTDLYGLGCVAYWLATGRSAFVGSSYFDLISKHMHATPDPPSLHAPNGLPPELDAVILACLEKDPDRRPTNARELSRRFASVPLADPWGEEEAVAWWHEHLPAARSGREREVSNVGSSGLQ